MKANNTISQFIETSEADKKPVICPACGQIMSLKKPSSYRRILEEKVRLNLDRHLQSFARNIEQIENDLEILNILGPSKFKIGNYPHSRELNLNGNGLSDSGIYPESKTFAAAVKYSILCDPFEHREYIFSPSIENRFPVRSDIKDLQKTVRDTEKVLVSMLVPHLKNESGEMFSVLEFLLRGFERASLTGVLIDLVFTQDNILNWISSTIYNDDKFKEIDNIVKTVTPNIFQYLKEIQIDIDEIAKDGIDNDTIENDVIKSLLSDPENRINAELSIKRVKFAIALLLGYRAKEIDAIGLEFIRYGKRFSLPKSTEVKIFILPELMTSDLILTQCGINWDKNLINSLNGLEGSKADEDMLLTIWKNEIHKLLNFCCTGPSGKFYSTEDNTHSRKEFCNWYPKKQPTHPVILLGSPGTGKSTAMQSGLSKIRQAVTSIDCTITFNTPESSKFLEDKKRLNDISHLPEPTKEGERFSVDFSIESTKPSDNNTYLPTLNFIFTDIPGETVNKLFNEDGADSVLLGILDNAETIVMFFDLSVDPDFRTFFTDSARESVKETWGRLLESYERTSKERNNKDDNSNETGKAKVNVSQTELLNKLIKSLKGEDNEAFQTEGNDPNFVCVITKADLYADFGGKDIKDFPNDKTLFMTDFFQSLRDARLLIDPSGKGESKQKNGKSYPINFDILQSQGGVKAVEDIINKDIKSKEVKKVRRVFSKQEDIIDYINIHAKLALDRIKNATISGSENSEDLEIAGETLFQNIDVSLKNRLYKSFGEDNVYFLPVSPAGTSDIEQIKSSYSIVNEDNKGGSPLRQKLSEYIFLLPIILSLKKGGNNLGA